MTYSVLIIDDHPLFSRGLAQLIETQKTYKIVGTAKDRAEALTMLDKTKPDLAIVDLNLGQEDGLELIKDFLALRPQIKVLVLSMHDERFYAERALKAGAKGYIMKEEAETNVMTAIHTVMSGEIYLSQNEKDRIGESLKKGASKNKQGPFDTISLLSDRQLQIFTLIGKGLGTVDIATKLNLSIKTIDTHKENIKAKLHCASSAELRQMAIEWTNKTL
ncbi:MAG: response regulator transcription factor [Treponema bryantii]|mgnify:FL=1|nr:response regulator transcription factor [Treponema bryantii]MBR2106582.1 response regulator transcription factor [Treponema sp.]MBR6582627.1 response regulator transcription factor [Treponema sp.]